MKNKLTILSILTAIVYFFTLYTFADLTQSPWEKFYFIGDKVNMAMPWACVLAFLWDKNQMLKKIVRALLVFLIFRIFYDVVLIFLPQYATDPRPVFGLFIIFFCCVVYTFLYPLAQKNGWVAVFFIKMTCVILAYFAIDHLTTAYFDTLYILYRKGLDLTLTGFVYYLIIRRIWR